MGSVHLRHICRQQKQKKYLYSFLDFFTAGISGVDAFAYDWSKYNNWIVPPVHLISRTISHMRMCKARGTLVIPKWKSAVFWRMIINRFTDNYQSHIKDSREYENHPKIFQPGSQENSIFAKQLFNSNALVSLI